MLSIELYQNSVFPGKVLRGDAKLLGNKLLELQASPQCTEGNTEYKIMKLQQEGMMMGNGIWWRMYINI